MLYHVIHLETRELKTLAAQNILDMGYDAEGRVVITDEDEQSYFLLASEDLISE